MYEVINALLICSCVLHFFKCDFLHNSQHHRALQAIKAYFGSMKTQIATFIFLLISAYCNAQTSTGLYVGTNWWHSGTMYKPLIHNYQGNLGQWPSLPVEDFDSGQMDLSKIRVNATLGSVMNKPLSSKWSLCGTMDLSTTSIYSKKYQRLRFNDMGDPVRGFVYPSEYTNEDFEIKVRFIHLITGIEIQRSLRTNKAWIGAGLNVQYVLQSSYRMNMVNSNTGQEVYYQAKDITVGDAVFHYIIPSVSSRYEVWSDSEHSIDLKVKLMYGEMFHEASAQLMSSIGFVFNIR